VRRTITVESDPPGALLWLNDNEIGRTPTTVPFTWYGTYSVRLEMDGYETLSTTAKVRAPIYQWLLIDLPFETVIPGTRKNKHSFRYSLEPAKSADADKVRQRAEKMRAQARDVPPPR
jgi:hypothetical protein